MPGAPAAVAAPSKKGLGRLILLIGLVTAFCWRGPDGALGLKWGDSPQVLPAPAKKLGDTEKGEQAWTFQAVQVPLGAVSFEVTGGEALFSPAGGLEALMFRLRPAPEGEAAAAIRAAHRLIETLGPPKGGKKPETLTQGATLEWRTRRSTIALGRGVDGSYNLLIRTAKEQKTKESL